jgi:hypothetical protein
MVLLLSIPIGIIIGFLAGGRLDALARLRFRWAWLAVAGLIVQVVIFSETGEELVGSLGPGIYVASTAAVFVAVLRNIRVAGMAIAAAGAACNLVAIATNGGRMPADPAALALAGLPVEDHLNSVVVANPAFPELTDIYAIPAGLPFANVLSVGDVLLGLGIVVVIALAMRRRVPTALPEAHPEAADAAPVEDEVSAAR